MAEPRLIDAEAFNAILENRLSIFIKEQMEKPSDNGIGVAIGVLLGVKELLKDAPTIEAKPVVHAHWINVNPNLHIGMKCSLCGARIKYSEFFNGNHRYCHKCGAQMDEEVSDDEL